MSRLQLLLIAALLVIGSALAGYLRGFDAGRDHEQSALAKARAEHEREQRALQAKIDAATARYQSAEYARQGNVREIYRESQSIVERPVYRNVCIDADGVSLLDRAAAAANGENIPGTAGTAPEAAESTTQ
ncbi:hypothetical protein GRI97_15865 [Altererythrobacter xixiisoli]|uniref:Uncharacterized protein n=1 Tax=Croceibacterium xixiisoli TaxID=1476466 RepID=A0A6I4TWQ6_9SPHN|nr:hypothetical protein [Croceibacterium xixiisoli]MXP00467.1 hypothetical protein [Croceibacterium xixiisoli]